MSISEFLGDYSYRYLLYVQIITLIIKTEFHFAYFFLTPNTLELTEKCLFMQDHKNN